MNGALNTYSGRTFIFYNDEYYGEMNECYFTIKKYGYTKDYFTGLPGGIDGASDISAKKFIFTRTITLTNMTNSKTYSRKSPRRRNPLYRYKIY